MNKPRQPIGIPIGGQFATYLHHEATVDLGVSGNPDRDGVRAAMGLPARTGLHQDSISFIAALMDKSGEEVYEENVATLAAAYGVSPDAIREADRITNHGELPLTVASGVDDGDADLLALGGLTGRLDPFNDDRGDLEAIDGGEHPLSYMSPTGRKLVLANISEGDFTVTYLDPYDAGHSFTETATADATAAEKAAMVRDALWDLAVTDAAYDLPGGLHDGEFYEVRETSISQGPDGHVKATIAVSNNDTGDWNHLTHDYLTGVTSLERDGQKLTGPAAEIELDAMLVDLRSEPENGDYEGHVKDLFGRLLTSAAAAPEAPSWARATAAPAVPAHA